MSRLDELLAKREAGRLLGIEEHELQLLRAPPPVPAALPPDHSSAKRGRPFRGRDRDAEVIKFYEAGGNLRETGGAFGLSHESVRNILTKHGIPLRERGVNQRYAK